MNGAPNGLWYTAPEQLAELYRLALAAGIQVHTHTNGDEATLEEQNVILNEAYLGKASAFYPED